MVHPSVVLQQNYLKRLSEKVDIAVKVLAEQLENTKKQMNKKSQIGAPFHFSQDKISVVRPSPLQGQHSFEIFSELLGMDRDEYEKLVAENISGEGPPK